MDIKVLLHLCHIRGMFTIPFDFKTASGILEHQCADCLPTVGDSKCINFAIHKFAALRDCLLSDAFPCPMAGDCHAGELMMQEMRSDWGGIGTNKPFQRRHSAMLHAIWKRREGRALVSRAAVDELAVVLRGSRYGGWLAEINFYARASLFTEESLGDANGRFIEGNLVLTRGLSLMCDSLCVFGRETIVCDVHGGEHRTMELCEVVDFVQTPQPRIVYRVLEYGAEPLGSQATVQAGQYLNISMCFNIDDERPFRVLAYAGKAHPLAAWAVPLARRMGPTYVASPEHVLCKLRVIDMLGNLWWLLHGVDRFERPRPGGDMNHQEYLEASV